MGEVLNRKHILEIMEDKKGSLHKIFWPQSKIYIIILIEATY